MKKVFFLLLLITISAPLFAQYTIESGISDKTSEISVVDPISKESLAFTATNEAYSKNLRRLLRKSRNSFETKNTITFSQYGYKNWEDGNDASFNGQITTYGKHIYTVGNFDITSFWDAAYATGLTDGQIWKTEDRFRLNSSLNYRLNSKFYYNFNVNLASQFSDGYDNKKAEKFSSTFFAPAYLTVGLGLNYKLDAKRYIIFSPISGTVTAVLDKELSDAGSFGLEPGQRTGTEFGSTLGIEWREPLFTDKKTNEQILMYRTSTTAFWGYDSRTPIFSWQNWLEMTVYKYFNVSFYWITKFDDTALTPNKSFWQFNEMLGIGLTYTFKNK